MQGRVDAELEFGSKSVVPSSATPYSDATLCRKKRKDAQIKRPMNPFMVFAQRERIRILDSNPNSHNAEISKQLGKRWHQLSAEQKLPFVEEAEHLKELHRIEFPDYKYQPRKRGRVAKSATSQTAVVPVKSKRVPRSVLRSTSASSSRPTASVSTPENHSGSLGSIPKMDLSLRVKTDTASVVDNRLWLGGGEAVEACYSPELAIGWATSPRDQAAGLDMIPCSSLNQFFPPPDGGVTQNTFNTRLEYAEHDPVWTGFPCMATDQVSMSLVDDYNNNNVLINPGFQSNFCGETFPIIDTFDDISNLSDIPDDLSSLDFTGDSMLLYPYGPTNTITFDTDELSHFDMDTMLETAELNF